MDQGVHASINIFTVQLISHEKEITGFFCRPGGKKQSEFYVPEQKD